MAVLVTSFYAGILGCYGRRFMGSTITLKRKVTPKPEPEHCEFDWEDFHKKLDLAVTHYITDGMDESHFPVFLSQHTILDLMEYSAGKAVLKHKEKLS